MTNMPQKWYGLLQKKTVEYREITYRICLIKRALRGGNDRVCVYLLVKNDNMPLTSKNSILLTVDKQDPRACPIHSPLKPQECRDKGG